MLSQTSGGSWSPPASSASTPPAAQGGSTVTVVVVLGAGSGSADDHTPLPAMANTAPAVTAVPLSTRVVPPLR